MASVGTEVVRIALTDLINRQLELEKSIDKSFLDEESVNLLKKQSELIKSTVSLFNRIY